MTVTPLVSMIVLGVLTALLLAPVVRRRATSIARRLDTRVGLALTALMVVLALLGLLITLSRPGGIELSHPTGFYDEPFDLTITVRSSETLYYTIDGSQPDPERNPKATRVVDGPIRVIDRSNEPNVYSDIPTTVEELRKFTRPDFLIPKATALRVRGSSGDEIFATYFIGERVAPVTLPTMSLIADPAYLFDHQIGIRVPGRKTEEWRQSNRHIESPSGTIGANYQMRGREWERPLLATLENPVVVQFCEADRSCLFEQSIGIRTHGGWTRTMPDKSWRLYAREEYGSERFEHQFFAPGTPQHSRLVLRNSGNDWNRLRFMDAFWHSVFPDTNVDTQAYRPTRLFVNGEYWGIYNIRERQDEHYVENVHGVPREHVEMLDNSTDATLQRMRENPASEGAPRQSPDAPEVWEDWVRFIEQLDPERPDMAILEREVDVVSFFDFVIAHTFAGVGDWVQNNSRWWRSTSSAHPPSADEAYRWRFMIQDFDTAVRGPHSIHPFTDKSRDRARIVDFEPASPMQRDGLPALFVTATSAPELRILFLNRYADLMNTALKPTQTVLRLEEIVALLEPEMELSRRRWSVGNMEIWYSGVDELREFLLTRPDVIKHELIEYFDLEGTLELGLELRPELEFVTLNTVDLTEIFSVAEAIPWEPNGTVHWSGDYFLGVPVTISTRAEDGYRFVGWSGLPPDAKINVDGSVTFIPWGDIVLRPLVESYP